MEIIKEIFSTRLDYIQALRNAPAPLGKTGVNSGMSSTSNSFNSMTSAAAGASISTTLLSNGESISSVSSGSSGHILKWVLLGCLVLGAIYLFQKAAEKKKEEER